MSDSERGRFVISDVSCGRRVRNTGVSRRRQRSRARQAFLACEALESRVVLTISALSTTLLGSLSYVGVVTSPVTAETLPILPILPILPGAPPPTGSEASATVGSAWSKLRADVQKLRAELESLAAKSGVTIADLQNLTNDSQAISLAGFHFGVRSLNSAISELAMAVAGGTSTTQAQADFTALFNNSNVSTSTITTTFNDLVQTIQDSTVTTTDLSTVAADEAAIQADISRLPIVWRPGPEPWIDQVGAAPDGVTVADIGVSPSPPVFTPPIIVRPPIGVEPPIIVSPFGNTSLLGALSSVGVVTSPVVVAPRPLVPSPLTPTTPGGNSQLQADLQKLQAELRSLAAKSGLTIADLQSLVVDSQAIHRAGFSFDSQSLNQAISELATAVAGGMSTTQAQTDFSALFNGSSVSTTTINTTFSDLIKAIQDSKVLPGDLTAVAADRAAIQADLNNLHPGNGDGAGSGSGGTGSGGTSSGGTTTGGTTGTGSTRRGGRHKAHVVKHKLHHAVHIKVAKLAQPKKHGHPKKH
jgi:predicted outer membrane protein